MRSISPRSLLLASALAAATIGCGNGLSINYHDGGQIMYQASAANVTSSIGREVMVRPTVKILDTYGHAVSGVSVVFTVTGGGGTVSGASVATDNTGMATVGHWTLGATTGINTLVASATSVNGSNVSFTADGVDATRIVGVAGNGLSALTGTATGTAPAVTVYDRNGAPVVNFPVLFVVTSGGGALGRTNLQSTYTALTNTSGTATPQFWYLGGNPGADTVIATSGSASLTGDPVIFSATATLLQNTLRAHRP